MINAVFMAAAIYSLKQYRWAGILWAGAIIAGILFSGNSVWIIPFFIVNSIAAAVRLQTTDGYIFYARESKKSYRVKQHRRFPVWRYLFRYLNCHKNYFANTAIMWCAALILPHFWGRMESLSAVPVGFAVLSLNTPICILLSSNPDLEQAVRFLPDQAKAFCTPYCLFIFFCNMAANAIFLCSWQIQNENVTALMILTAVFFALQSAVLSVLLEWFFPIRD